MVRPDRPRQLDDDCRYIGRLERTGCGHGWKRAAFCRVCSDETAIEALERGRALPLTLITLSKSRLVSQ